MEKYKAKPYRISTLVLRFLLFFIAIIVIPELNVLSGFIESVWHLIMIIILTLTLLEIALYFKKGEDYIAITENGIKTHSKFGATQECRFTDEFKYNYRRRKLKSIVVFNEKHKVVLGVFNRYEIELSELKNMIEERRGKYA